MLKINSSKLNTMVTSTTTGYDINKISRFRGNWNSASLLNSSPYKELTAQISLAFVTTKSDIVKATFCPTEYLTAGVKLHP